jgi:hypothetical protein
VLDFELSAELQAADDFRSPFYGFGIMVQREFVMQHRSTAGIYFVRSSLPACDSSLHEYVI